MDELDLTFVDRTVDEIGIGSENVLKILHAVQGRFGYLPREALERVCKISEITPASIEGVSSFYDHFRHRPVGRHIIHVCVGTACHVKGADRVHEAFYRHLGIPAGEDTDAQKLFTVEKIACLGCCTLAPAVQIDNVTYGHLTPDTVSTVIGDFLRYEQSRAGEKKKTQIQTNGSKSSGEVRLGLGSCCVARGSGKLKDALENVLADTGIKLQVKRVGCVGMCHQTPLLEVVPPDGKSYLYARVRPEDARAVILRHFKVNGIQKRISNSVSQMLDTILTDEKTEPVARRSIDVRDRPVADFLGRQKHIATENHGEIDPVDIDEYIANGGFKALQKCIREMSPEEIISEIERSGLRGRGGAGFPTGLKWTAIRNQQTDKKFIVCNGDEGDPGAFMDRMLMESYPYRIIEGMIIAACAVMKAIFIFEQNIRLLSSG